MAALPNHERATEESRCMFRWLHQDFQASGVPTPEQAGQWPTHTVKCEPMARRRDLKARC